MMYHLIALFVNIINIIGKPYFDSRESLSIELSVCLYLYDVCVCKSQNVTDEHNILKVKH